MLSSEYYYFLIHCVRLVQKKNALQHNKLIFSPKNIAKSECVCVREAKKIHTKHYAGPRCVLGVNMKDMKASQTNEKKKQSVKPQEAS